MKELEYRYLNVMIILKYVNVEYKILNAIAEQIKVKPMDVRPLDFLMHVKNYVVHVDSFIDYLSEFLRKLNDLQQLDLRFDRKSIEDYIKINSIRNQIHHESLPTVDYNYTPSANAHSDLAPRDEVFNIMLRWPLSNQPNETTDLKVFIDKSYFGINQHFETVIVTLRKGLS